MAARKPVKDESVDGGVMLRDYESVLEAMQEDPELGKVEAFVAVGRKHDKPMGAVRSNFYYIERKIRNRLGKPFEPHSTRAQNELLAVQSTLRTKIELSERDLVEMRIELERVEVALAAFYDLD